MLVLLIPSAIPSKALLANGLENTVGVTIENVDITSSVWETPEIPLQADMVAGVANPVISLNETTKDGTWKFLFDGITETGLPGIPLPIVDGTGTNLTTNPPVYSTADQSFDPAVFNGMNWQNIAVPGNVRLQDFNVANNREYYYQRQLNIPADYASNRVVLRFDAVFCNARIWIDGKYVRTHIGGFTTWDADITDYVTPGASVTLTIGVANIQSTSRGIWNPGQISLEDPSSASRYASHNISGINRDAYLLAYPKDYIARVYADTVFDENFVNADLKVTAQLGMISDEATLKVELFDKDGLPVVSGEIDFAKPTGISNLSQAKKITIPVAAPLQWDAEHPNLYTLKTSLSVKGAILQTNSQKIGFREITYGGARGTDINKVYINGKEVKLRGVNRHDVSVDMGRSTTKEQDWYDIQGYKEHNVNFIRTSHYPVSRHLLDACDAIGIYVLEENAVCFKSSLTTNWAPEQCYVNQFTEMVERDKNRPSVIMWSLGNESHFVAINGRTNFNYVKDVDPSRPVQTSYPDQNTGSSNGNIPLGSERPWDVCSIHYLNWDIVDRVVSWDWGSIPTAEGVKRPSTGAGVGNTNFPLLHDEVTHPKCYNPEFELRRDMSARNFYGETLKMFWDGMFAADGCLGGAIWGGIDEVFHLPDGRATGYGYWGCVFDIFRRLKPEAYLTKKALTPVRIDGKEETDVFTVIGNTLTIPVYNRFDHTDFAELEIEYSIDDGAFKAYKAQPLAPHAKGNMVITDTNLNGAKNIHFRFVTPFDGIMVEEFILKLESKPFIPEAVSGPAPTIADDGSNVIVSGADFQVVFSKAAAQITSASYKGDTVITSGPRLHVMAGTGGRTEQFTNFTGEITSAVIVGDEAVITLEGSYAANRNVRFTVKISGNGIITTSFEILGTWATIGVARTEYVNTPNWVREIGVSFGLPENYNGVSWIRDGLYSMYPKDHIGRSEGVAPKVRPNYENEPQPFGEKPPWAWKDDMRDFWLFAEGNPEDGIVTNDFKTMREYVWRYDVNFAGTRSIVRVESDDARNTAVRVDQVTNRLVVNMNWCYPDIKSWYGNYDRSDHGTTMTATTIPSTRTVSLRLTNLDLSINEDYEIFMVSKPDADNSYNPEFAINNLSGNDKDITIILAAYVKGRLAALNTFPCKIDAAGTLASIPTSLDKVAGAEYQFFVWDDKFVPLTGITSVSQL